MLHLPGTAFQADATAPCKAPIGLQLLQFQPLFVFYLVCPRYKIHSNSALTFRNLERICQFGGPGGMHHILYLNRFMLTSGGLFSSTFQICWEKMDFWCNLVAWLKLTLNSRGSHYTVWQTSVSGTAIAIRVVWLQSVCTPPMESVLQYIINCSVS